MSRADDSLMRELHAAFRVEASEHVQAIGEGLMALEKAPEPLMRRRLVESIFRAAHSLKGAARSTELREIEDHCQELEEIFARWKREDRAPLAHVLDQAHRFLNTLAGALERLRPIPSPVAELRPRDVPVEAGEATVRVAVSKLDARLANAEEMLTVRLTAARRASEIQEISGWFEAWRREWRSIEGRAITLRRMRSRAAAGAGAPLAEEVGGLLDFVDWNLDHVRRLENQVDRLAREVRQDRGAVFHLVDELLEESKKLLLVPFSSITGGLPKVVRDLCREQDKEADLVIAGGEVEIDRRVLEAMKDPLLHMLRNSVDHGVEPREERERLRKPARATIALSIVRIDAGKVMLRLEDDGRGIDAARVRAAAVDRGLVAAGEAEALSDDAVRDLVFRTGLSTSPAVTPLSGRGLGLAIVRERAERLGGAVSVGVGARGGTRFEVLLPTTLATFRGILLRAGGASFVAPNTQVEQVGRAKASDVLTIEGRATIATDGRRVPLVQLAEVLELSAPPLEPPPMIPFMVLGSGDARIAFVVDEIVEELEVLAKPFLPPLVRVRNLSGATVLGSGHLAPILNVADLLKSARRASARREPAPRAAQGGRSLLVVEDSITSRMLLKGILEAAGYTVKTAADGMEAFELLRSHAFDLVVSDVDMPRLDGFGLTQRIRADGRLASLPVVLVTTLGSSADRERGIDAGANAYIVKSGFDQDELLDAVRRLTGEAAR